MSERYYDKKNQSINQSIRGNALMTAKRWNQAITDFNLAIKHRYCLSSCCLFFDLYG